MKSFVVVDDHEFLLDAISYMVEINGHFVSGKYNNFQEPYEFYKKGEESDYIIVDFYSKKSNAIELVQSLRKLENCPFIVVISYVDEKEDVEKIEKACSPDLFIRKSKLKEGLIKLFGDV